MSEQSAGSKSTEGDVVNFVLFSMAILVVGYLWVLYGQTISLVSLAVGFFLFLLTTILAIKPIKTAPDRNPGLHDLEVIQYIGLRLLWGILLAALILYYHSNQPAHSKAFASINLLSRQTCLYGYGNPRSKFAYS